VLRAEDPLEYGQQHERVTNVKDPTAVTGDQALDLLLHE
jgi:hypothetical protein